MDLKELERIKDMSPDELHHYVRNQYDEKRTEPVIYGYVRVSTRGQSKIGYSLEAQERTLREKGAQKIYADVYTGAKNDRPQLERLLSEIKKGDTLIVTKLDRIARSVQQGVKLIDDLIEKGVIVYVINLGIMDDSPNGKLIRHIMLTFAEFEREMIMQRTNEGKEMARIRHTLRDGRPKKFTTEQLNLAMKLLDEGDSFKAVAKKTGISTSTLARERAKRKADPSNQS